jgi:hypothetical protein
MSWKSKSTSGTTSSKAGSLFGLDAENGKENILVYRYRSGASALEVTTQQELCRSLDSGKLQRHLQVSNTDPSLTLWAASLDPNLPFLRVTKKEIPRGNSRLDVRAEDLLMPEDREKYKHKPTLQSSVANVGLPSSAYWKRVLFDSYKDLYIVSKSPKATPESSLTNTPESSQHVSPSTTFPVDSPHRR